MESGSKMELWKMESLEKLSLKRSVASRDLLKREGVYFQKFHTLTAPQLRRQ